MRRMLSLLAVLALALAFAMPTFVDTAVAASKNPCNPCAAKAQNPCNPCAAKKKR